MNACSQGCSKPAVFKYNGHKLCIDCAYKIQSMNANQHVESQQWMNYLNAEMDALTGIDTGYYKFPVKNSVVYKGGPMTFNNIQVDRSTIGAINTGYIDAIGVSINKVQTSGNEELSKQLIQFTKAVLEEKAINESLKNEILEHLSFILEEISKQGAKRPSIIKAALTNIKDGVSTINGLATLWANVSPIILKMFGM